MLSKRAYILVMENTAVKQLADRFSSNWRNQPIWQCTIRKGKHDTRFPGKRKHITHLFSKAISQYNLFDQSLTALTILVCGNFTLIASIIGAKIFPNKSLSQQRKKNWNCNLLEFNNAPFAKRHMLGYCKSVPKSSTIISKEISS